MSYVVRINDGKAVGYTSDFVKSGTIIEAASRACISVSFEHERYIEGPYSTRFKISNDEKHTKATDCFYYFEKIREGEYPGYCFHDVRSQKEEVNYEYIK